MPARPPGNQPPPFLVYGTLRRGEPNFERFLAGFATWQGTGVIEGCALYGHGMPFPAAVDEPGGQLVVEAIAVEPCAYRAVLLDLDRLEGFRPDALEASHYLRVLRRAHIVRGDGSEARIDGWLYLASARTAAQLMPEQRVASGDWNDARRARYRHPAWSQGQGG